MFLEELVAVVAGEEASSLTGEAGEQGYTQPVERERERPQDGNPVTGGCLPRRDAGEILFKKQYQPLRPQNTPLHDTHNIITIHTQISFFGICHFIFLSFSAY